MNLRLSGLLAMTAATISSLAPGSGTAAEALKTLYSFCAQSVCVDGREPYAGLIMDAAGRFYGTTITGGAHVYGAVFELTPNAAKTAWTETVLYSFCAQGGDYCTDGLNPEAGLIMDAAGRLYGTTLNGGAHTAGFGGGTVFVLTPNATRTKWTETLLYSFCAHSCEDGEHPAQGGLIMDKAGKLYGTTIDGGTHGGGTVFALAPNSTRTTWTESVLYSFCAKAGCTDGAYPFAGRLVMDAAGRLYGTTEFGGANGRGTAFMLTPNAARTVWTETVLHSFCSQGGQACTDGDVPRTGLIIDKAGTLYGDTSQGGAHGMGTVYGLTPNTAKTAWSETELYSFCAKTHCADGAYTQGGGLIMDAEGRIYGTTGLGGANEAGTVFVLTPNAAKTKWTEAVLSSFCTQGGCTDGLDPQGDLIMDAAGHLYGTTEHGGAYGRGTVFALP